MIPSTRVIEAIQVHCKACGKRDVPAHAREEAWRKYGFTIAREYYARCQECGQDMMIVGLKADEIVRCTADELETHLIGPASARGAVLTALALVLF